MLKTFAERTTEAHLQAGDAPVSEMVPVESSHRIVLPRRSGESAFAPQQYCYAASKSGVVPSPLLASGVSQRNESSDAQRDAA
jgi:hypothetical protein